MPEKNVCNANMSRHWALTPVIQHVTLAYKILTLYTLIAKSGYGWNRRKHGWSEQSTGASLALFVTIRHTSRHQRNLIAWIMLPSPWSFAHGVHTVLRSAVSEPRWLQKDGGRIKSVRSIRFSLIMYEDVQTDTSWLILVTRNSYRLRVPCST